MRQLPFIRQLDQRAVDAAQRLDPRQHHVQHRAARGQLWLGADLGEARGVVGTEHGRQFAPDAEYQRDALGLLIGCQEDVGVDRRGDPDQLAHAWLVWSKVLRQSSAERLAAEYRVLGFPSPERWDGSAEEYLKRIANDDEQPVNVRLAASRDLGALSYPAPAGHFMESVRLTMTPEDAVDLLRIPAQQS